jgi:hypothetical protein
MQIKSRILKSYRKLVAHPNPWFRRMIGVGLIIGGLIGPIVPVLGFWMLPLGVIVLIADLPQLRPIRRRYNGWWRKRFNRQKETSTRSGEPPDSPDR